MNKSPITIKHEGKQVASSDIFGFEFGKNLNAEDFARIQFRANSADSKSWADQLKVGHKIEFFAHPERKPEVCLFKGRINRMGLATSIGQGKTPELFVEATGDVFQKLRRIETSQYHGKSTLKDIFDKACTAAALELDFGARTDDHLALATVEQNELTHFDFFNWLLQRYGYVMFSDYSGPTAKLVVRPQITKAAPTLKLRLGAGGEDQQLGAFEISETARAATEVEVRYIDPKSHEVKSVTAKADNSKFGATSFASATNASMGTRVTKIGDHSAASEAEAKLIATAKAEAASLYLSAQAECEYQPVQLADTVKITIPEFNKYSGSFMVIGYRVRSDGASCILSLELVSDSRA